MKPLRFVGVGTGACVLFTLLIVLFLVPALLSFGKDKEPNPTIRKKGGRWLDRQMSQFGEFVSI